MPLETRPTSLLSVKNLSVSFSDHAGQSRKALDGLSFKIEPGETFALVGESGSGKSISALSVLRLLPNSARIEGGEIFLGGTDLLSLSETKMGLIRGQQVGMVFQDPMTALNPVLTIGQQLLEVIRLLPSRPRSWQQAKALDLLDQVGLPEPGKQIKRYPHQLSGGMRQRVLIAMALAGEPKLRIADEPTTALDVTLQAQILELLKRIQKETGMSLWVITHDFGVVAELADRVAVMRSGKIIEEGLRELLSSPKHEYTSSLLSAIPRLDACLSRKPLSLTHDLSSAKSDEAPLLQVSDLRVFYPVAQRVWGSKSPYFKAVDGVSLDIHQAETRALVGESGCGKSTFGRGLLGLLRPFDGSVRLEGNDITHMKNADRLKAGLVIQVVFQDPYSSMNPRMLIQDIVAEGLLAKGSITGSELHDRVELLLSSVGLSPEMRFRYPHEFSGGQRQRISIARALALDPKLIVCDEPTSSLDVSVQAKVLELLKQLQLEKGISYLFITHDLAVVSQMADTVSVMKEGSIIECGSVEEVLFSPQETYTRSLIRSLPSLHKIQF